MKVVVATNNKGKLEEFQRILKKMGMQAISLKDLDLPVEIEETGDTFEENARLKAEAIFSMTGFPTIADDSGLLVEVLQGAPGVKTARYAGENASNEENMNKLLKELEHEENRKAKFISCIVFQVSAEESYVCTGECEGTIGFSMLGTDGFGYDPIFMVGEKSFAQLSAKEKDRCSHRGNALIRLEEILTTHRIGEKNDK